MKTKQIIAAAFASLILVGTFCACSENTALSHSEKLSSGVERNADTEKTYNFSDGAEEPPAAYNSYANLLTGYELKLFRAVAAESGSASFGFSPADNALDLALLANGAKGDAQSEIMLALGTDLSIEQLNTCSSYFKSRLEAVSGLSQAKTDELSGKTLTDESGASIKFSDALLLNDKTDVRSAFLQLNADFYGADIFRFDFSDDRVNTKLNELSLSFPADCDVKLESGDTMVVSGTAQISDLWLTGYAAEDIFPGSGEFSEKNVSFMRSEESYIHTDTAKGIIKYTAKNPLKLVLIMPNENVGLEKYLKSFDNNEYMNLIQSFGITSKVSAVIPQFQIKADEQPTAMSGVMEKSGLYTLFSDKADFGNIAHTDSLVLNEFYELRTGFRLDKNGLSTSAGAEGDLLLSQAQDSKPQSVSEKEGELRFDRPFIFMLIDNESNIPVYMGTYQ